MTDPTTTQMVRTVLSSIAVGVLLSRSLEDVFPIYGLAVAYIAGAVVWDVLRRVFPLPESNRTKDGA